MIKYVIKVANLFVTFLFVGICVGSFIYFTGLKTKNSQKSSTQEDTDSETASDELNKLVM